MDIADFRSFAIASAEQYYQFLEREGRGRATTHVRKIEQKSGGFLLSLDSRFSVSGEAFENLIFLLHGKEYSSHQLNPISYDRQAATLFIRPSDPYLIQLIASASARDLLICSDLKFLVRRVRDWYDRFGFSVHLSRPAPSVPLPQSFFGDPPTPEQHEAICGALTQPFSYIWGAPGTGKTRCVLANCVIACLLAGKRVLLVAPTNNAVEQMLFGLMPVLKQAGFSTDQVLRLGVPSAKFARQYPSACESAGLGSRKASIDRQLNIYRDCLALRKEAERLDSLVQRSSPWSDRAAQLHRTYMEANMQLQSQRQELLLLHSQQALSSREMERLLRDIRVTESTVHSLQFRLRKILRPNSFREQERKLSELYRSLAAQKVLAQDLLIKIPAAADRVSRSDELLRACAAAAQDLTDEISAAVRFSPTLTQSLPPVDPRSSIPLSHSFFAALDAAVQQNHQLQEQYEAYTDLADAELSARIDALVRERSSLENADQLQFEGKCIVAATIDRYISTFYPGNDCKYAPDHLFVDEASYCSLIKAAALLSSNIPIIFLGDHMQLPPVCEMKDELLNGAAAPIFLWSQSAIYLEDIFTKPFDQMLSDYRNRTEPVFGDMPKYSLTLTHRFGNAISAVLARSVYSSDFRSADPEGTSILVLDAPRVSSGDRQSISEANAIAHYLASAHPQDFAILTPYRRQRNLLLQRFPAAAKEGRVLTVHASQGREWDTLIFSPVDNEPSQLWYANSLCPGSRGKAVINTAISRARKRLVLVCDCSFWDQYPNQLITQLIASANTSPRP